MAEQPNSYQHGRRGYDVGRANQAGGEEGGDSRASVTGRDRAPSSWLAPAIVATLCCFSPTGVVAVYFAAQVSARWSNGDRKSALRCARIARTWVFVSIVLWVLVMVILVATGRAGRFLEAGVL
ncbi:MAG: CD225/dispanin family protein [Actinobacteria bacterium]|nr:CD225/dispanin family protein [Actinomycetota bacterium]